MSASLVGSEMCIRDRMETQRARKHVHRAEGSNRKARLKRKAKRKRRLACLLYTSDAADDM
eukprot:9457781-Alexandrium_andersonii.AAC.1